MFGLAAHGATVRTEVLAGGRTGLTAVVVAVATPFTFAIGTRLGFVTHAVLKLVAGQAREVGGALWLIGAASLVKFGLP